MRRVLVVSKPLVPPWNDSSKNLARDIVSSVPGYTFHVMGTPGSPPLAENVVVEPLYSSAGSYAPAIRQNIRVLFRLIRGERPPIPIYHFFFAPNLKSSAAARTILRFKKRRTVHTVSSAPLSYDGIKRMVFADRVVALSAYTASRLEAGLQRPVEVIPPCIPSQQVSEERRRSILRSLNVPRDVPLVLFAGDYVFSNAARVCLNALPEILAKTDALFLFAVRVKQEKARQEEAFIKAEVQKLGLAQRTRFFNEVEDMEALASAVTVNVLPTDSLYGKMDFPLVLLESMRAGVPVVTSDFGPLPELMASDPGVMVPAGDAKALAHAVVALLESPQMRAEKGANGRRAVEELYSPHRAGARYREVYESLLLETDA